jgi:nucleotide-binding universal stress UspA family protein
MEPTMTKTMERVSAEVVVRPDTYKTLLVHAEPGLASSRRVEAAARLARELGATLIGLGAETFEPIGVGDPFMGYAAGEWVGLVLEQIGKDLTAAEAAFRRDAAGADLEWRSVQDYPHKALNSAARAADLIVVGPRGRGGSVRSADPADVVMSAGRPVLVVPESGRHLRGQAVVVAWKDTRECRRAVADAMPFLQRAEDVIVHAVVKPEDTDRAVFETDDVVTNLKRHGVDARALVTSATLEGVTLEIERVAQLNTADLIVCGAYGHSRLREWAFGGVTDDLIHRPGCFVLMSH